MPELPEVETIRRQLEPRLAGRRVLAAGSHPSAKFVPGREAAGARFGTIDRRGKYLLISLDDDRELIVHLGMTGRLAIVDGPADRDQPHLRAWWVLDRDQTLEFTDVRRFGRLRLVPRGDHSGIPTLANAGPEPWDPELTGRRFHELLARSRRPLKTQLLSQRPIAGVGNIYADEALWLAGINPVVTRVSRTRATVLLDALRHVLSQGIENGGTTLRDYRDLDGGQGSNQLALSVYGRGGLGCPRCAATLRSRVIDARTTTWCPRCQR
jgi:formamidopyrimidine-DNA glycosylase